MMRIEFYDPDATDKPDTLRIPTTDWYLVYDIADGTLGVVRHDDLEVMLDDAMRIIPLTDPVSASWFTMDTSKWRELPQVSLTFDDLDPIIL